MAPHAYRRNLKQSKANVWSGDAVRGLEGRASLASRFFRAGNVGVTRIGWWLAQYVHGQANSHRFA